MGLTSSATYLSLYTALTTIGLFYGRYKTQWSDMKVLPKADIERFERSIASTAGVPDHPFSTLFSHSLSRSLSVKKKLGEEGLQALVKRVAELAPLAYEKTKVKEACAQPIPTEVEFADTLLSMLPAAWAELKGQAGFERAIQWAYRETARFTIHAESEIPPKMAKEIVSNFSEELGLSEVATPEEEASIRADLEATVLDLLKDPAAPILFAEARAFVANQPKKPNRALNFVTRALAKVNENARVARDSADLLKATSPMDEISAHELHAKLSEVIDDAVIPTMVEDAFQDVELPPDVSVDQISGLLVNAYRTNHRDFSVTLVDLRAQLQALGCGEASLDAAMTRMSAAFLEVDAMTRDLLEAMSKGKKEDRWFVFKRALAQDFLTNPVRVFLLCASAAIPAIGAAITIFAPQLFEVSAVIASVSSLESISVFLGLTLLTKVFRRKMKANDKNLVAEGFGFGERENGRLFEIEKRSGVFEGAVGRVRRSHQSRMGMRDLAQVVEDSLAARRDVVSLRSRA